MKATLWDMDGTLLNPNGSIRGAINGAVKFGGFAEFADEEILVGLPLREILSKRTTDAAAIESMVEEFRRISYQESWQLVEWYPGVRKCVEWAKITGLQTAVVTTKGEYEAEVLLQNRGERQLFDTIVGDNDRRELKPHPAPVLEACKRLRIAPEEAVMIGDTKFDVHAGKAAGCPTIGVAWGHGSGEHGPDGADYTAHSGQELLKILQDLYRHNP